LGRNEEEIPYWKRLMDISKYVKKLEDQWGKRYNIYVYTYFPSYQIYNNKNFLSRDNVI
jgi:hypothetical protein